MYLEVSDSLFGIAEDVDKLKNLGFERSARFKVSDDGSLRVDQMTHDDETGGVYVFVLDDEVIYVDKNSTELSRALRDYKHPGPVQGKKKRINRLLKSKLEGASSPCYCWYLPEGSIEGGDVIWETSMGIGKSRVSVSAGNEVLKMLLEEYFEPDLNED